MASTTYGDQLTVAFSNYIANYEAVTASSVRGEVLEALAANYAMEAAKDVTSRIMESSTKLSAKTTRPIEFSISKRRIDAAWEKMNYRIETTPFRKFKDGLVNLLNELSTPSEAEFVSAEVIGDQKMIFRTTSDYKEILTFLNNHLEQAEESVKV